MKILLDENIDIRFKNSFPETYKVFTVKDMGWNGIKNGELYCCSMKTALMPGLLLIKIFLISRTYQIFHAL